MNDKTNFLKLIQECIGLLESVEEQFWSNKMKELVAQFDNRELSRLGSVVLTWYGGIGSFQDLILSSINGHSLLNIDQNMINEKLNNLRERIYEEASNVAKH